MSKQFHYMSARKHLFLLQLQIFGVLYEYVVSSSNSVRVDNDQYSYFEK